MRIEFWKMTGAGNDFIVINNMDLHFPEEGRRELFERWCRRGTWIGADGVLLTEPSSRADFRMRYYNADGGEAETCGNGSRCIARFAHEQGIADKHTRFETLAGDYEADVRPDAVAVGMTDAHSVRDAVRIFDGVFEGEVHFINTGVPHVVIFSDDLAVADVARVGRHLRHHAEFQPAGTNVNFVSARDPHNLDIRTYERGVEAETLACGTGSIASAIIAARQGLAKPPVRVKTASGAILTIEFEPAADGARKVVLSGEARIVFRGEIEESALAASPKAMP
jgi:diaminopimelate epimerase